MDKEKILSQNKKDNLYLDEYEKHIKVICKEPYNDIMTIIWSVAFGYMSYEAYLSRSKPKFVTALFFVLFMLYYFYKFLTAGL